MVPIIFQDSFAARDGGYLHAFVLRRGRESLLFTFHSNDPAFPEIPEDPLGQTAALPLGVEHSEDVWHMNPEGMAYILDHVATRNGTEDLARALRRG